MPYAKRVEVESFPAPTVKFDEKHPCNWNMSGAVASHNDKGELLSEHLRKVDTRKDKELAELLKTIPADSADILWDSITADVDEMYCLAERVIAPIKSCMTAMVECLQAQGEQVELIFAPLKSPVKVFEKATKDYDGLSARVLDIIRCRIGIVCDQLSGLLKVLLTIDKLSAVEGIRRKNKFHPKSLMPSYFRNILMSVQVL